VSAAQFLNTIGKGLGPQLNSPSIDKEAQLTNTLGRPTKIGSTLDFTSVAETAQAQTTAHSPLKSHLASSQTNLRSNMFGRGNQSHAQATPQASSGYQPSFLREPSHKNSSYLSQSPNKQAQHRFTMMSSAAKSTVGKYGQHFSGLKRQQEVVKKGAEPQNKPQPPKEGDLASAAPKFSKPRSGSTFQTTKKFG